MDDGQNQNGSTYTKRPLWIWALLAIIIIVLVGGGYYFVKHKSSLLSSYQSNTNQQQNTNSAPTQVSPTATPLASPSGSQSAVTLKQITVVGKEFAFTPSAITVNKGEKVDLTFKNTGTYPHNLTITDLGVKTKTIQPGEQDTISFVPDKMGSFKFMCTVPGHADKGMVGTLTVK